MPGLNWGSGTYKPLPPAPQNCRPGKAALAALGRTPYLMWLPNRQAASCLRPEMQRGSAGKRSFHVGGTASRIESSNH